jgi:hypothetical protein
LANKYFYLSKKITQVVASFVLLYKYLKKWFGFQSAKKVVQTLKSLFYFISVLECDTSKNFALFI